MENIGGGWALAKNKYCGPKSCFFNKIFTKSVNFHKKRAVERLLALEREEEARRLAGQRSWKQVVRFDTGQVS